MKKILASLCIFFLIIQSASATISAIDTEDLGKVQTRVTNIKASPDASVPEAPTGNYDQKGYVGEIMTRLFDNAGKVRSIFVTAFSDIMAQGDNVPKWSGSSFELGTIWDKGGNIGVGENNPTQKLDVDGSINFTGDLYKNGSIYVAGGKFVNGVNPLDAVYENRNVGIGTNNPTARLEVAHAASNLKFGSNKLIFNTNTTGGWSRNLEFASNGDARGNIGVLGNYNSTSFLYLDARGDDKPHVNSQFVLRSSGRVGIGVTNPATPLHVASTARFDGGVQVDGTMSISATNISHSARPGNNTEYTGYGLFESRNAANDRGFYLGGGNNKDIVYFNMDDASRLSIGGGRVGIGNSNPTQLLDVSGTAAVKTLLVKSNPASTTSDINLTGNAIISTENNLYLLADSNNNQSTFEGIIFGTNSENTTGMREHMRVATNGRVGIGVTSPETTLHVAGTARFDGGISVDGLRAISSSNASHTTQHSNYGYFEGRNADGDRGFYLGSGNGGDRTNLILDNADKLYIGKSGAASDTLVGIGTTNPQAMLHVAGNIISKNPTANNHVATKSYVDTLVTAGVSWKAPVKSGSTPTAEYGACNASKEGWATYNKSDNVIYLCNASSWVNIGSTAVIPYATTTTAGRIQIAGDITGTWDNITLKNNVVESENIAINAVGQSELAPDSVGNANIKNSSILNKNIAVDAAISGTKINPSFGSQNITTNGYGRINGGLIVDGRTAINSDNRAHNAYPAAASTFDNYGYFGMYNKSGKRGAYIGGGNGGDRVNIWLDTASKLYIGGGNVGIGVANPTEALHVAGNVIADTPTKANHLATKKYIDDKIVGFSGECKGDSSIQIENGLVVGCTAAPAWSTSAWSACSASCGGGDQNRTVTCKRGTEVLPNSQCTGTKPTSSRSCNTQICVSCKTYTNISGTNGGIFRGGTPGMDQDGDANFYYPDERTADKLCAAKGYAEGGWTLEDLPTNQGWAPYGNITIWQWNGSSGDRLCTSGGSCNSSQIPYIRNLECCTGKEPARPKCSAGYWHAPEVNRCVKVADYTCNDRVNCTTPKLNICQLYPSLKNGDQFKLTVSADGSSWVSGPINMTQTYTKGTAGGYVQYGNTAKATNGLNPVNSGGNSKQNYNNQFYDGNCLVWGQSIYSYKSSNSKTVKSQVLRVVKK